LHHFAPVFASVIVFRGQPGLDPTRSSDTSAGVRQLFRATLFVMLPAASPQVIFKSLPDGAVLYHPAQEVYYGLNGVGEKVWQRLPPVCRTLDDLCGQLADIYPDVPAATIRSDVSDLLDDLLQNQLVVSSPQAADARHDDAAAS
jgi:hypothetical protein